MGQTLDIGKGQEVFDKISRAQKTKAVESQMEFNQVFKQRFLILKN